MSNIAEMLQLLTLILISKKKVKVLSKNVAFKKFMGAKLRKRFFNLKFFFVVSEMLTSIRNHVQLTFIVIVLFEVFSLSLAQRVAPGVPPQQYVSKIHSIIMMN